jgi:sortase A
MARDHAITWLARLMIVAGLALLVLYGVRRIEASRVQADESLVLDSLLIADANRPSAGAADRLPIETAGEPEPSLIGRLEIPRLHLSVMVMGGDDDKTLDVAAGHLPDTPLPWQWGNTAIAGHRDGFFEPLKAIRLNDLIRLETPHGEFHYEVTSTRIVKPEDVWILEPSDHSLMTLITCYPFRYVGHAPERFIIQAARVDR